MKSHPYNPRSVPDTVRVASEAVPENRTNRFTKNLIDTLILQAEALLSLPDPSLDQMATLSGAMNTACLLTDQLTGTFFEQYPDLSRGGENFSDFYLQSEGKFV